MIGVPEYVKVQHSATAKDTIAPIHKDLSNAIDFFEYQEEKCIQMLHRGPFIYEFETLGKLEQFAEQNSLIKRGVHHEIYLVDFTKEGSKENFQPILRYPTSN